LISWVESKDSPFNYVPWENSGDLPLLRTREMHRQRAADNFEKPKDDCVLSELIDLLSTIINLLSNLWLYINGKH
jgi:hypothetical protein